MRQWCIYIIKERAIRPKLKNTENIMEAIIKGRKIDPTRSAMEMRRLHISEDSRSWPAGTVYEPASAGVAGARRYQDVVINGEHVRFTAT